VNIGFLSEVAIMDWGSEQVLLGS